MRRTRRSWWRPGLVVACALAMLVVGVGGARPTAMAQGGTPIYLPIVARAAADAPPDLDEEYGALTIEGEPETRPAAEHPDLNLAVRGYEAVDAERGLVEYGGASDPDAPQLVGLLGRMPRVLGTYQVYAWDWARMARGAPIISPPVTLITLAAGRYEVVRVPDSGHTIGDGFQVLVLFADTNRVTLKYTREDNVIEGYTLHLEGVRVAPDLLALYRELDGRGRGRLPALRAGQAVGWARDGAVGVAVRDAGSFLDPRSRKDWWQEF